MKEDNAENMLGDGRGVKQVFAEKKQALIMADETLLPACEFCGRSFASRNQIFKHLRDATGDSLCGTAIVKSQQSLPTAPSAVKKEQRKASAMAEAVAAQARRRCRRNNNRNTTGQTAQQQQHCLWIGDLPLPWTRHGANYKRLRALFRAHLPRTVPQPWIKVVQRKAYRTKLIAVAVVKDEKESSTTDTGSTLAADADAGSGGVYLGYAIVVFRDDLECQTVLKELDGREISVDSVFSKEDLELSQDFASLAASGVLPFFIKVRPAESHPSRSETSGAPIVRVPAGRDPPLEDQLRPLSTEELMARTERLVGESSSSSKTADAATIDDVVAPPLSIHDLHSVALERAVAAYEGRGSSRPEVRHKGRPIPDEIRDTLLTILQNLRWAVPNHRPGLTAERYLVLLTSVTNDLFYQDLRDACRQLVNWADPFYYYSGIAVTKNFVSSPHIDDRDQTFQYAVSLGDFNSGGELCVDGFVDTEDTDDGTTSQVIHVFDTHNRIARVDGRHVHWVRTWAGGDRYSVIFYDTRQRQTNKTAMAMGVVDVVAADEK